MKEEVADSRCRIADPREVRHARYRAGFLGQVSVELTPGLGLPRTSFDVVLGRY